jgi:tRNA pseudouridine38-40 synthase
MSGLEMTHYRAVVAYDGSGYFGFQRQAGGTPTIQGELETAVERVTGQQITLKAAGRTDTGVHATGQVIAFELDWGHTAEDLGHALNANLPDTVAVQSLDEVEKEFHPRFDARSRVYEYALYVAPARQPLLNRYAWHVPVSGPLDAEEMRQAALELIGVHDFATFGQPPQGESTLREVMRSELVAMPEPILDRQVIRYRIEANAFLYRMVRRIVGALVRVGSGNLSLDEFAAAFRAADGTWPNQTAPAHGLCLVEVMY